MITPDWAGETCFIVACGPSLTGFNSRQLLGRGRIITINDSFEMTPFADVLYFCDARWWQTRKQRVRDGFQGRRIVTLENKIDNVTSMKNTGELGLEEDPAGLRHGHNSGYQAIGLAYHFGVRRICLLGYDMKVAANGKMHWNQRPENQNPQAFHQTLQRDMLPHFDTLVDPLKAAGVQVVNSTPDSALKAWPYVPLEKVLNACRR